MTTTWPQATLTAIDTADDLKISPLRPDAVTFGTPTWIWSVVVDGELYVRGYNGTASRWYQAAMDGTEGRIRAAGQVHDVTFEPAPAGLAVAIDEAYRVKYASSPYLPPMLSGRARAAGVRISPHHA